MYWLEFVALIGATGALVNAWLLKDGLFENWRLHIDWWSDPDLDGAPWKNAVRSKINELFKCRVCLSYHVAFWLVVLFFIPSLYLPTPWSVVWFFPVYALAITRFSLLISLASSLTDVEGNHELDGGSE